MLGLPVQWYIDYRKIVNVKSKDTFYGEKYMRTE